MNDPILVLGRFWSKVGEGSGGCWAWTGCRIRGYGYFRWGAQMKIAHRLTYESMIGEIPPDLELDHLCRNRACVNPYHLDPVPHTVNLRRGDSLTQNRTHCRRGHDYAVVGKRTGAGCVACHAATQRAYQEKKKEIS